MKEFIIKKSRKVIIYGASVVGIDLYQKLIKKNFQVIAFIDKRAEEIKSIYDIPVYFENLNTLDNKDNCLVIIAVKNVFEHEDIADFLKKKGFYNLLYRPMDVLDGGKSPEAIRLNDIYTKYVEGNIEDNISIPINKMLSKFNFSNEAFICDINRDFCLAYIPMELVYTDLPKANSFNDWRNLNIYAAITYSDLYEYFDGKNSSAGDIYLDFCRKSAVKIKETKTTEQWEKNIFRNRFIIYMKMTKNFNLDWDFFLRNAPEVKWNIEKKYFNLLGCKHRTSFLAYKGLDFIAVKMTKEDLLQWENSRQMEVISKKYYSKEFFENYTEISHPYFNKKIFYSTSLEKNIYKHFIKFLAKYLYEKYGRVDLSKIKVIDYNIDKGYFIRSLSKTGAYTAKYFENEYSIEIFNDFNELLYVDNIGKVFDKSIIFKKYDLIAFEYFSQEKNFFEEVLRYQKIILIKFAIDDKKEIFESVYTKYKYKYEKLCRSFSCEKIFEVGVLMREFA